MRKQVSAVYIPSYVFPETNVPRATNGRIALENLKLLRTDIYVEEDWDGLGRVPSIFPFLLSLVC